MFRIHLVALSGLFAALSLSSTATAQLPFGGKYWQQTDDSGNHIFNKNPGSIGIGTNSPVGAKLHVKGWIKGNALVLEDDKDAIYFPVSGPNNLPMIYMFGTAVSNSTRMVLAHSPLITNYGLEYSDVARRFTFKHGGSPIFAVDDEITAHQPFHVHQGIQASGGLSWWALTFDSDQDSIVFPRVSNANPEPMIQMFESGTQNNPRMVLSHSPAYENWGLEYRDSPDEFHFLRNGATVMNVDLGSNRVAIGSTSTTGSARLQVGDAGDGSFAIANSWSVFSSRDYKKDIEALDAEACRELKDEVVSTPVFRFRYKEETEDVSPRLGLIIEESPDYALSEQTKGVDLSRYVTALHAALKAQDAELKALRRELEGMRADS